MKIEFNLKCQTEWGSTLFVLMKDKKGNEKEYEMFCQDGSSWLTKVEFEKPIKSS